MKRGSLMAYTGLALAAIIAVGVALRGGSEAAPAIRADLLQGQMARLSVNAPVATPDATFTHENGQEAKLSDYRGKVVVLNFWASWCAPCRKEMPSLSRLQARLDEGAEVVTIATGPSNATIAGFMEEIGVDNLPLHTDPQQSLARAMGVLGLPVTVIIDQSGREVARLVGDAEWDGDEVLALIAALTADG